jgi:hypothetical protein
MSAEYFAALEAAPAVITGPGPYITRGGESVEVTAVSRRNEFGCFGVRATGALECWHRSGRLCAEHEFAHDIVAPAPRTYRHFGMDFAIVAEFADSEQGAKQANAFMEANPGAGLLAVEGGRVIIAALSDKGTKP